MTKIIITSSKNKKPETKVLISIPIPSRANDRKREINFGNNGLWQLFVSLFLLALLVFGFVYIHYNSKPTLFCPSNEEKQLEGIVARIWFNSPEIICSDSDQGEIKATFKGLNFSKYGCRYHCSPNYDNAFVICQLHIFGLNYTTRGKEIPISLNRTDVTMTFLVTSENSLNIQSIRVLDGFHSQINTTISDNSVTWLSQKAIAGAMSFMNDTRIDKIFGFGFVSQRPGIYDNETQPGDYCDRDIKTIQL